MANAPEPPGPYLTAAILCESVLQEKDNLKSVVRIVDQVIQSATGESPPETMVPFVHHLAILVTFKRGMASPSEFAASITTVGPSGRVGKIFEGKVVFSGDDPGQGVDITGAMDIRFEAEGLYWFEVRLDGAIVTRIPLRVIYQRSVTPTAKPGTTE